MFRVHGGNGFGRIALLAFIIAGVSDLRAETWKVPGTYTLPKIGLSAFLDEQLGLANIDDHNIDLGGIGSDLWHSKANDGPGIYWMITNRGPNGEDPRIFPVPEFTPFILKLRRRVSRAYLLNLNRLHLVETFIQSAHCSPIHCGPDLL